MKSSLEPPRGESQPHSLSSNYSMLKCVEAVGRHHIYQVAEEMIPFIFHFSELLLSKCQLSPEVTKVNPLASEMFEVLKERITPKRKTSRTGRPPTRMKYE